MLETDTIRNHKRRVCKKNEFSGPIHEIVWMFLWFVFTSKLTTNIGKPAIFQYSGSQHIHRNLSIYLSNYKCVCVYDHVCVSVCVHINCYQEKQLIIKIKYYLLYFCLPGMLCLFRIRSQRVCRTLNVLELEQFIQKHCFT